MFTETWLSMDASINQSDRLRGMAEYMNASGSLTQWLWLGLILICFGLVVVGLRWVSKRQQKKMQAKKAQAKRDKENERAKASKGRPRRGYIPAGRRPSSPQSRRR